MQKNLTRFYGVFSKIIIQFRLHIYWIIASVIRRYKRAANQAIGL
jgi:hypothetical protein